MKECIWRRKNSVQVVRRVSSSGLMKLTVYNADFLGKIYKKRLQKYEIQKNIALHYVGSFSLEAIENHHIIVYV